MVDDSQTWEGQSAEQEDDEEGYELYRIVADPGQEPLRVDKFLVNRTERLSRNRIQQASKAGGVRVDGTPVKPNFKVKPGMEVTIVIPQAPRELELLPEDISLQVVYEDRQVSVINKAAGMVVHPGHGNYTGTLVNALLHHYNQLPDTSEDNSRPGLVHRLDKNTSGLMVVAREDYALTHLARQFFDRTTERTYVALVWGDFDEMEGEIEGHIGRHERDRLKMDVFPEGDQGKYALTRYKVLKRFGYVTLVECKLATGRTHQIRVHMAHIGHPLFNDDRYGGDHIVFGTVYTKYKQFIENCFKVCPRHALHAKSLGFEHPETGEWLQFDSALPQDMQDLLHKWERYTVNLEL